MKLAKTVRKRQLQFMGHVMRKEGLENLALTGNDRRKETTGKTKTYIPKEYQHMDEEKAARRRSSKRRRDGVAEADKEQTYVEGHDRPRPQWIRHPEEEKNEWTIPALFSKGAMFINR